MGLASREAVTKSRAALALLVSLALFSAPVIKAPAASASTQGSVSGSVYTDINGNGTRDGSDPALSGRTVFADLNSNGVLDPGEPWTTSSVIGTYTITSIEAGTYPIVAVSPSGWITTSTVPSVNVIADDVVTGVDIGSFKLGSIAGTTFGDVNGNGLKNTGDTGLQGVTVFMDANTNGVLDGGEVSTTSDSSGGYSFSSLTAGSYVIRIVLPSGNAQTNANPSAINVQSGTSPSTIDFGLFARGSIDGSVYYDLNGNGVRDSGEPGYSGASVFFDTNGDGLISGGETSTTTDGAGAYSFTSLNAGTYAVTVILPSGFGATSSSASPQLINSGSYLTGINFGISDTGIIAGTVFEDTNSNGTRELGEAGITGRTVFLDTNNDGVLSVGEANTTTDSSGAWSFIGLTPGSYRPRLVVPTGTSQTTTSPTSVTVTPGAPSGSVAFGLFTQGVITGNVFIDTDGNGALDSGENGTAAKTVYLDLNNNNSLGAGEPSTTSDSLGNYTFTGLASGTYRVKVIVAAGSLLTTTLPSPIVVTSGTSVGNVNFGLFSQGSISGLVYNDVDGDGTRDIGDGVIASRTVFLDNNNNGIPDVGEPTQVSNSSGVFTFSNLGPGGYRVRITPPTNTIRTSALLATVSMTSGLTSTGNDVGLFTLGSISGTVYNDTNANAVKNTGEAGLLGRTVFVDLNGNGVLDTGETTAITGSSGVYNFTGLVAGTYTIRLVEPAGQTQTTADPPSVNVVSGTAATNDFGLYLDSTITGTVFDDSNGNALLGAGEPGVSGVTVYLDANNNNTLDSGEQSAITNSSGLYALSGLGPSSYRVKIVVPSGRVQTTTNPAPISPPSGGTTTGVNFGVFTTASIAGSVYDDTNGNGNVGTGEPMLPGMTVYLDINASGGFDTGEPSTTTDSVGTFSFTGLGPGSYRARIVVPTGWIQTSTNPAAVVPTSGSSAANITFGMFQNATLTGFVFTDVNGNGALDAGEAGLPGKTVFLDTNNSGTLSAGEPTTLSDASGNYSFVGLGVGTFRPRVIVPGDSVQTTTNPAAQISTSGAVLSGNNFGLFVKVAITGTVYNDVAGNGVKDVADGGIGSRTVFADLDNDGTFDSGEPSTTTTASGLYTISNLGPGTYNVRVVVPTGTTQTSPVVLPLVPQSGSTTTNVDFGLFTYATISGTVYNDTNGNGAKNAGELGLSGRTVYLDLDNSGTFDAGELSTTSSSTGTYSFSGLVAGNYQPRVVVPSNTTQSSATPSSIAALSQTASVSNDFGLFTYASIAGNVYEDSNGNGLKGTTEVGRTGITVYIDSNANSSYDSGEPTTLTNGNGDYSFTGLSVGTYRVRPILPTNTIQTSSVLAAITTASGSTVTSQNIGLFTQGTISGTVFNDIDGSGTMDAGEDGVAGRTVFIDSNSNGAVNAGEPTTTTDGAGAFTFGSLGVGSYKIRVVVPSGVAQTTASPTAISVMSSTAVTGVTFGLFTTGSISGTAFNDTDGNATRGGNESASASKTVYLDLNNDGAKEATEPNAITNGSGTYLFTGLAAGTYRPRIVVPAGTTLTTPVPAPIVIASGTSATGVDFGLRPSSSTPNPSPSPSPTPSPGSPGSGRTDPITANQGYWITSAEGGVFAYGSAQFFGSAVPFRPQSPIVAITPTATGGGYWQVSQDGGIFAFGDAQFLGSMGGKKLNKPIVGMAATPTGNGYWLVASDGGIFAYGDAKFFGSTGSIRLNQPIVGMAATSTGNGYWLVASDGGIFAYGDAKFYGSTGSLKLNRPITGMTGAAGDTGYWLAASDGGIFAFGSAKFSGSKGGQPLNEPIVSIKSPGDGLGYWLVPRDGGIFAYGSAKFYGGHPESRSPIVN